MSEDLIISIYNSFNPFEPLNPGDPKYVDCSKVRGDEDIFREIGKKIIRSQKCTYQLYTGHRGVGKSTELLRLKQDLESKDCFVVYFGATEDIDEQDVHYTDILLACTRHILQQLRDYANDAPVVNWLKDRWTDIQDLASSELELESIEIEPNIDFFAKLTASIRKAPSKREEIRKKVDLYGVSLIKALNIFIQEAMQNTKFNEKFSKLVVIADNLDRIAFLLRENGRTNYDEIFLDYHTQLTSLQCHIVYTAPLLLVYSDRALELRNLYDSPEVLPMIMVKDKQYNLYKKGIDKMTEILCRRIQNYPIKYNQPNLGIFDTEETRVKLCQMTGGYVRELMLFMQTAMDYIDDFPITEKSINRALNDAREKTYRIGINQDEWNKLAIIARDKIIPNEIEYRSLLFRRCVLEYWEIDEKDNPKRWYDVHPLIEDIDEFKTARDNLK
ncbi:ATP-binding protein [Chroococcus sp. FPU101]|uniref:ATP-binding protein n=1 Tax=Chroococcus sp. FPU101 TaxID=1974212 RepID=UPI001A901297|nr:ATP-binding protein [Chroococcus sp. FPU101]GFE68602.1 hypothetical protein CFPU101_12120 [Chroococcus sp. FPU101]